MIKKTLCDIMNGYSMPEGKSPSGILFVTAGKGTDGTYVPRASLVNYGRRESCFSHIGAYPCGIYAPQRFP